MENKKICPVIKKCCLKKECEFYVKEAIAAETFIDVCIIKSIYEKFNQITAVHPPSF